MKRFISAKKKKDLNSRRKEPHCTALHRRQAPEGAVLRPWRVQTTAVVTKKPATVNRKHVGANNMSLLPAPHHSSIEAPHRMSSHRATEAEPARLPAELLVLLLYSCGKSSKDCVFVPQRTAFQCLTHLSLVSARSKVGTLAVVNNLRGRSATRIRLGGMKSVVQAVGIYCWAESSSPVEDGLADS